MKFRVCSTNTTTLLSILVHILYADALIFNSCLQLRKVTFTAELISRKSFVLFFSVLSKYPECYSALFIETKFFTFLQFFLKKRLDVDERNQSQRLQLGLSGYFIENRYS